MKFKTCSACCALLKLVSSIPLLFFFSGVSQGQQQSTFVEMFSSEISDYTDFIKPSDAYEAFFGFIPTEAGTGTLTLPDELYFPGTWIDRQGGIETVTFDGQTATVILKEDRAGSQVWIDVYSRPLSQLPEVARTIEITGAGAESVSVPYKMFYQQVKVSSGNSGSVTEDDIISYTVEVTNYPFSTLTSARLTLNPPIGTDLLPGSISGQGSAILSGNNLIWNNSPPTSLYITYQVKVWEILLIHPSVKEIVNDQVFYRSIVESERTNRLGTVLDDTRFFTTGGTPVLKNKLDRNELEVTLTPTSTNVAVDAEFTVSAKIKNISFSRFENARLNEPTISIVGDQVAELLTAPTTFLPPLLNNQEGALQYTFKALAEGKFKITAEAIATATGQSTPTTSDRAETVEICVGCSSDTIVNVTGDEEDADSEDGVVDVDLTKEGNQVTLRAAIKAVNDGLGDEITFDIPGTTVPTITLTKGLPAITKPVKIDGTSQTAKLVEIKGAGLKVNGLDVQGGNSEIRGLVISGFDSELLLMPSELLSRQMFEKGEITAGIRLSGAGGNKIAGNYFGTDATGNSASPNTLGILIDGNPDNIIGGEAESDKNVIFGSVMGILMRGAGADHNRIAQNHIGLSKDGSYIGEMALGIGILHGNNTQIGGEGTQGNLILAGVGIYVLSDKSIDALVIGGNRIGLDETGTNKPAPDKNRFGIQISAETGGTFSGFQIQDNYLAGHVWEIALLGQGITGAKIINNRLGLAFDESGSLPAGVESYDQPYGIRLDGAPETEIINNTIAGHLHNVVISGQLQFEETDGTRTYAYPENPLELPEGTPVASGVVVQGNTIGIFENSESGGTTVQWRGVTVFSNAKNTTISGNTIAGHTEQIGSKFGSEIWIQNGSDHSVSGNVIGTNDGTDRGSQIGLLINDAHRVTVANNIIGRNEHRGVEVEGSATETRISGNTVGTNASGSEDWKNGIGISISRSGGKIPADTTLEDNVVVNSGNMGILVNGASNTTLKDNRVGVSASGAPLPNVVGVKIVSARSTLTGNTIAHNLDKGILIEGTMPVSIASGPIYENGDGTGVDGIAFDTLSLVPAPQGIVVLRTPPENGADGIIRLMVPPIGGVGDLTLEIYGSLRDKDPQGRFPLLRKTVKADERFAHQLEAGFSSPLLTYNSFSVTATRNGSTSQFSSISGVVEFTIKPELDFVDARELLVIRWSPVELFKLQEASSVNGPWADLLVEPGIAEEDGVKVAYAEIPDSPRDERFFRTVIDWDRILSNSASQAP